MPGLHALLRFDLEFLAAYYRFVHQVTLGLRKDDDAIAVVCVRRRTCGHGNSRPLRTQFIVAALEVLKCDIVLEEDELAVRLPEAYTNGGEQRPLNSRLRSCSPGDCIPLQRRYLTSDGMETRPVHFCHGSR